jgi:U3 small nucleolar RNA-associated protein 18
MEEQGSSDQDSQDSDQDGSEDDSDDSDHEGYKVKGAWEDEDDKRLKVSLVASNITKKLRNDVDEDVISGVEYSRRLRKQYVV